jgi:hypothetical protein
VEKIKNVHNNLKLNFYVYKKRQMCQIQLLEAVMENNLWIV